VKSVLVLENRAIFDALQERIGLFSIQKVPLWELLLAICIEVVKMFPLGGPEWGGQACVYKFAHFLG